MYRSNYWEIRVTHLPTGISAERTSDNFRTQFIARDSAIRYLKSRIVMLGNPPMREDELKFEPLEWPSKRA